MKGETNMKMELGQLLAMLMYGVDRLDYYNKDMVFLYSFEINEIPENCTDEIVKFNLYNNGKETILEVVEE